MNAPGIGSCLVGRDVVGKLEEMEDFFLNHPLSSSEQDSISTIETLAPAALDRWLVGLCGAFIFCS